MKSDFYLSFVVVLQLICVTLQLILPLYGFADEESAARYRVLLTVCTYIPGIAIILRRKAILLISFFMGYIIIALFNYLLYPHSHMFLESSQAMTLTPISILTIVFMLCIKDIGIFIKVLVYLSRVYLLVAVLYLVGFFFLPFKETDSTYSMAFGYATLLPCMVLLLQKNWYDLLISSLLIVIVLFAGSRGPLVVVAFFILVHIFCLPRKQRMSFVFLLTIIGIAIVFYILNNVDIEASRTLRAFVGGEALEHDTRDLIYDRVKKYIQEGPVLGWGMGADRQLIGTYSHNILLELSLHYGIPICFFIALSFIFYIFRSYKSQKNLQNNGGKEFYLMFLLFGLIPMMVSGSYLINYNFALMMGYLLRFSYSTRIATKKI